MPVPPEPHAAMPLRVLYVEDNRINAILFEEALRLRTDVELRLAENGEEALQQVQQWRPHMLVLDSHLPGMNGCELLGALRRVQGLAEAPAFMCSADASPDDVRRAGEAGFIGYWPKPIDLAQVLGDLDGVCLRLRTERAVPGA